MKKTLCLLAVLGIANWVLATPFSYSEGFEDSSKFGEGHALGTSDQSGQDQGWDYTWTTPNDYELRSGVGIGGSRSGIIENGNSTEVAYHFVSPADSGTRVTINPADGGKVVVSTMVSLDHWLRDGIYGFFGPQLNTGFLGGASQFVNMLGFLYFVSDANNDQLGTFRYNDGSNHDIAGATWSAGQWYQLTATAYFDTGASKWNTWDCLIETVDGGTGAVTGTVWSGTNLGARHEIADLKSGFYANSFYKIDNFSVQQIPEPATVGLLALGGLLFRRKG